MKTAEIAWNDDGFIFGFKIWISTNQNTHFYQRLVKTAKTALNGDSFMFEDQWKRLKLPEMMTVLRVLRQYSDT